MKFLKLEDEMFLQDWEAPVQEKFPEVMVLMNINGCLVHRTGDKISFAKPKGEEKDPKYDRWVKMFRVKKNFLYCRDGYMDFLRDLMNHPRVSFSFYSTIMRKNILPIILEMFKENDSTMGLLEERLFNIFDQEYNRSAPEITGEKFGFVRDLDKVLASKKVDAGKSKANILMLDSDEVSVHDCFENSLVIDRYERSDVWFDPAHGEYRDQVQILKTIKADLFAMLDACGTDVREFISASANASEEATGFKWSEYLRKAKQVRKESPAAELTAAMENLKVDE